MNYFDYGPQNSRGFRALKVWLTLRQVGRAGYLKMIGDGDDSGPMGHGNGRVTMPWEKAAVSDRCTMPA